MSAARAAIDPNRRGLLAKLHMARKELALTEESYRDILRRTVGVDSAADADMSQLELALEEFKRLGFRPTKRKTQTVTAGQKLVRALWLALHNIGAVHDGRDTAIDAFVQRQARVSSLRFLAPADQARVIQALRDWLAREGVPNSRHDDPDTIRRRIVQRQWQALCDLGVVRLPGALAHWLRAHRLTLSEVPLEAMTPGQLDRAAVALGDWLRRERAKRAQTEAAQ